MNEQVKKATIVYIITIMLTSCIGIIRYLSNFDIMGWSWFNCKELGNKFGECGEFSAWPFSHFILYLILGYLAPKYWFLLFIIGICWEIIEFSLGKVLNNLYNKTNKVGNINNIHKNQYENIWITGMKSDILFNSLGLFMGVIIAKMEEKPIQKERIIKNNKQIYRIAYTI